MVATSAPGRADAIARYGHQKAVLAGRYGLAAIMVLGPLLQAISWLVAPLLLPGDDYVGSIAAHPQGFITLSWLGLAGAVSMAPALIGVGMVAMRGAPMLGLIGMVLAIPGMLNPDGNPDDVIFAGTRAGVPIQTVNEMSDRLGDLPAFGSFAFWAFGVFFGLGGLLLGVAVLVGKSAPRWAAICLIVASATSLAAMFVRVPDLIGAAGWALATVGFAGCAVALVQRPAPAWTGGQ